MAIKARTDFTAALNQVVSEKGIDLTVVLEAIEQAALAAYRKDLSLRNEPIPEDFEELQTKIDHVTGEISILRGKENITPPGFARIAAQTAKQVILQRLHEAEKTAIMEEYAGKVGVVISGMIRRQEGNTYFVDLGRAEGVLPVSEQTRDEYYHANQRLKFFVKEIRDGHRGPEVVISRTDPGLIKGLFGSEVPEIATGAVVIKDTAREAGSRTKVAVISTQEGVDPVGSLVGQKGIRVQAVMNELGEEKIDIIPFYEEPVKFIAAALSPAKDVQVTIVNKEEKQAKVKIASSQLSLAIGKGGQNVRLAAKLTGYKIDIEGMGEGAAEAKEIKKVMEETKEALEVGEQPIPTDETVKVEGRTAVQEKVEEEIDQAVKEESLEGAVEPEPTSEEAAGAVVQAEEDIAKNDEGKEREKLEKEDLGSMEETKDTERGSLIATDEPEDAETSPVNTSEEPEASPAAPKFPAGGPSEADEERLEEDRKKEMPTIVENQKKDKRS